MNSQGLLVAAEALLRNDGDPTIVGARLLMVQRLSFSTVAEGVSDGEQVR